MEVNMKKILLLGDSIRLSYQSTVREMLNGRAEVEGPEDNCRFAKYTLWYINEWLNQFGKPDIIHWNNGIWDIYRINDRVGLYTPLEEYRRDMARILAELRQTGANIIWATTTAVDDANGYCRNDDIDVYNKEMIHFMLGENITVNDLNRVVRENLHLYMGEDKLHLNETGKQACAEAVVKAVSVFL
jgi:hypothetical protein